MNNNKGNLEISYSRSEEMNNKQNFDEVQPNKRRRKQQERKDNSIDLEKERESEKKQECLWVTIIKKSLFIFF
jgi:hypothetical protein